MISLEETQSRILIVNLPFIPSVVSPYETVMISLYERLWSHSESCFAGVAQW